MRQMMVQLGASTGLMGKIPGFKQFSQMKKLANMDINALMARGWWPAAGPRRGRGAAEHARDAGHPDGQRPRPAEGLHAAGHARALVGQQRAKDKQKARDKRKAEKAARKKNRR